MADSIDIFQVKCKRDYAPPELESQLTRAIQLAALRNAHSKSAAEAAGGAAASSSCERGSAAAAAEHTAPGTGPYTNGYAMDMYQCGVMLVIR